jgi:enoyl-CoA hydratase/carnithine racemase
MELKGAHIVTVPPSLTASSVAALRCALESAASAECRAIVLRGATAPVFCRGLDFAAMAADDGAGALDAFADCLRTIRVCGRPTVAFVEGEAMGGGVGIAAAADAVLATTDATFAVPELLFGFAPAIVRPYLAERVAPQKLRWLALLSARLDAAAALAIGLVDRVETAERCPQVLNAWLARLGRVRADSIDSWKRLTFVDRAGDAEAAAKLTAAALARADVRQRLDRFADTGVPPWRTEDA